jgi:aspartyl-tRNA(Asn)/glutamyl-tRNA(Gln) amidotransferase subunit B
MSLHPIIGLEIHVQLNTNTKLFCSCKNEYSPETPNQHICPFCTGQPGALPQLNQEAVKKAIILGVALDAQIPARTRWDRKNYFYPDSPNGYQISQYDNPIVMGGSLNFFSENRETGEFTQCQVALERAHLEADAAKLIHTNKKTLIDFNRSGAPLIEVVTMPQIFSAAEAMGFVTELQMVIRRMEISDGDMEKGQMRFDCNISLQNEEEHEEGLLPGYKVEIKNINSVRSLGRAIEFEIKRQTKLLEKGELPVQETRGWRDDENKSESQRSKEQAQDYRYFPEPDLKVLELRPQDVPDISELPELPHVQRQRFLDMGIPLQLCNIFVHHPTLGDFFDDVMMAYAAFVSLKNMHKNSESKSDDNLLLTSAHVLTGHINPVLIEEERDIRDILHPKQLVEIADKYSEQKISKTGINTIIDHLLSHATPKELSIDDLIISLGILQVNDDATLEKIVDDIIIANPGPIEEYQAGKVQVIGFLVGQCMKASKGQGNAAKFKSILEEKLS